MYENADVVDETKKIPEKAEEKTRDFDEEEAFFMLVQIFSEAQATKNYAKFQSDLAHWKRYYDIKLFSDKYRTRIRYMLSIEFLEKVLKDYLTFDRLSKKDPNQGLEKLRKVLKKAENHKDAKQLDKDLDTLYEEYPLNYLKEKFPHITALLLSKSNRTRILEKFDSSLAFKELNDIIENPQLFKDVDEFKETIEEWKKLYPLQDFNEKFKSQTEKLLSETLEQRRLNELFPTSLELDLNQGEIVQLGLGDTFKNISLISKDALHDFFKITNQNKGDINGLFKWICTYSRYINGFDNSVKIAIVDSLMGKYGTELPSSRTKYSIPKMETGKNDYISLKEMTLIDDTKKQVVLQFLGILASEEQLTSEDIDRLDVIDSNVAKVEQIKKAKIEPKLSLFLEKLPENKLTPSDPNYIKTTSENTFKDSIKAESTPLERVTSTTASSDSSTSSTSTSGGSGGTSLAIPVNEEKTTKNNKEKDEAKTDKEKTEEQEAKSTQIQAVILEANHNKGVKEKVKTTTEATIDKSKDSIEVTTVVKKEIKEITPETKINENTLEAESKIETSAQKIKTTIVQEENTENEAKSNSKSNVKNHIEENSSSLRNFFSKFRKNIDLDRDAR